MRSPFGSGQLECRWLNRVQSPAHVISDTEKPSQSISDQGFAVESERLMFTAWAVPAAAIVALEYVVAVSIGFLVGFHYRIPFASYFIAAATVVILSLAAILSFKLVRALIVGDTPADFSRFAAFACGVFLVGLQMAVLSWLKVMLPLSVGFWADAPLAHLDSTIFQTDPWRLLGVLDPAAMFIDRAYMTWAPAKFTTLIILFCLPSEARKSQALVAYFLIAACVMLGQYLLPSAGPVFYGHLGLGDRFADMPVRPWVATTVGYLWTGYLSAGGGVGTGISAMPSLHVAVALWLALVIRSYLPRLQFIGWAYFAVILVGSVYLGWHYALDGIVAVMITLACWRTAPALFWSSRGKDAWFRKAARA